MGIGKPSKIVNPQNTRLPTEVQIINKRKREIKKNEDKNKEKIKIKFDSMKKMEYNINIKNTKNNTEVQHNNVIVKKVGRILSNIDNNNENINNDEFEISFIDEKPHDNKYNNINQKPFIDDTLICNEIEITNVIFSIIIPKKLIKDFTQLYLNNEAIQNEYYFEFKEDIILIYHIKIREDLENGELKPYFIGCLKNEYYYYYCYINYVSNKNNFIYNINWKTQLINNKKINLDLNISNRTILIHFYFIFLQTLNEGIELIKDLIMGLINELNSDKKINFNEFLILLIKSIQLKNEISIQRCLYLFKNPYKFEYK